VQGPRDIICELSRQLYTQGWVSGTGGGVSVRERDRYYIAPSGVQKERLQPADIFVLDEAANVIEAPSDASLKISACTPLFYNAYRIRGAGAVLHSHSINAMLATLIEGSELRVTHLEMMKGISGVGYHDEHVIPIIENTAHEADLASSLADAMRAYPKAQAVLVRRHGVYVWGPDWVKAKTQAECYDYLFEASVRMRQLGIDPSRPPQRGWDDETTPITI